MIVYIPFPGTILKKVEIVSAIGLNTHYEKSITGYHNHCSCRRWINCCYYNKMKWKEYHDDEHLAEILKWYETHFRIKFEIPDAFPNG
jgi:hypothetical protein